MKQITKKKSIMGIVLDKRSYDRVITVLEAYGFKSSDISALIPSKQYSHNFVHKKTNKCCESAVNMATAGLIVSVAISLIIMRSPTLSSLIGSSHPLVTILSVAAIGVIIGGVSGWILGLNISTYEAIRYEDNVPNGNILISVHTDDEEWEQLAMDILMREGAQDISTYVERKVENLSLSRS